MDLKSLHSKLVAEMGELLYFLIKHDCQLCLVGGVTRDFLMTGKLVHDVDFEARSQRPIEEIICDFPDKLNYEKLAYGIIKVRWNMFSLEFSPPRWETFVDGDYSHKNFTATIDQNLTYEKSFARRDFTINAIGIEFTQDQLKMVDPYSGYIDLQNRMLNPVSENFYRDPVRFLRLIRFSLRFNLKIGEKTNALLSKCNLQNLTNYYFKTEWKKAKNANKFLELFHELTTKHQIKIPDWAKLFQPLATNLNLETPSDYLVQLFYNDQSLELENPQDFFDWGKSDFISLQKFIVTLKKIDWKIIDALKKESFEVVKNNQSFLQFHDLLNLDRQGRFSTEALLQSLPSEVKGPYLKFLTRVISSSSIDPTLKNVDKALYKSFQRII